MAHGPAHRLQEAQTYIYASKTVYAGRGLEETKSWMVCGGRTKHLANHAGALTNVLVNNGTGHNLSQHIEIGFVLVWKKTLAGRREGRVGYQTIPS